MERWITNILIIVFATLAGVAIAAFGIYFDYFFGNQNNRDYQESRDQLQFIQTDTKAAVKQRAKYGAIGGLVLGCGFVMCSELARKMREVEAREKSASRRNKKTN